MNNSVRDKTLEDNDVVDNVMDKYQKTIELPSRGYLGGPKEIVIRAMTAAEEKILFSSKDWSFIRKIVLACTVSPKDIDIYQLLPEDLVYVLYRIRELTFGPEYLQPIRCSHCNTKQNAVINIANFEYTTLPEDVDSKLSIELPISNLKATLKLLSKGEIDDLDRETQKIIQRENIQDPDGYSFIKRLMAQTEILGKDFNSDLEKYSYFLKMHAMDINRIRNTIDSIVFGINTNTIIKCENKNCGVDIEVNGTVCPEFFRPTM